MYKSLDKKGKTVMRINAIISGLIILIITGAVAIPTYLNIDSPFWQTIIIISAGLITLSVILDILLFPKIRYNRYKYLITDERIEVKKGLFLITTSIIQIKRVQKIELSNGPIDRIFNLSNVNIFTAAGTVDIKFLNNKEAQEISDKVNELLKNKLEKKHEN
ncbi:MAG: PH domain-containing protein [Bacilli bacterium]|nr:PH domain-containing protein [Bacilli bacterium]